MNNCRKGDKRSHLCIFLTTCHQTLKKRCRELAHAWHSCALNWSVVLHACCMCISKEGGNARSVYTANICLEKGELFYHSPSVTVFITLSEWVLKPTYLYKYFYLYVLPWTWILRRDRTCIFPQRVNKQWSGPRCLVLAAPVQSPRDFSETGPNKQTFLPAGSAPGRDGDKGGGMMSGCPDQVALPDSAERRLN